MINSSQNISRVPPSAALRTEKQDSVPQMFTSESAPLQARVYRYGSDHCRHPCCRNSNGTRKKANRGCVYGMCAEHCVEQLKLGSQGGDAPDCRAHRHSKVPWQARFQSASTFFPSPLVVELDSITPWQDLQSASDPICVERLDPSEHDRRAADDVTTVKQPSPIQLLSRSSTPSARSLSLVGVSKPLFFIICTLTTNPEEILPFDDESLKDSLSNDDLALPPDGKAVCKYCDGPLPDTPSQTLLRMEQDLVAFSLPAPEFASHTNPRPFRTKPAHQHIPYCQQHSLETKLLPEAVRKGWPLTINWKGMMSRVLRFPRSPLRALLEDPADNIIYQNLEQTFPSPTNRVFTSLKGQWASLPCKMAG